MASVISAGTTSGTSLNLSGDTSGVLQLASNGSTTALTIDTNQRAAFVAGTAALPAITTTGDTNTGIFFPAADTVAASTGGTERMRIDFSGNVLVGNNLGSYTGSGNAGFINLSSTASTETQITWVKATQVEAHAGFKTSTDSNFYINTGGALGTFGVYLTNTGTSWTSNSDERLKENLTPIVDATNKVSQLRAVIGNYISDESKKARPFLIAQDVQAVLPEAVSVNTDELGTLGVSYTDVIPLLVASIKELKAIVDAQAIEIAELKAK